jgi:hypothetical protein
MSFPHLPPSVLAEGLGLIIVLLIIAAVALMYGRRIHERIGIFGLIILVVPIGILQILEIILLAKYGSWIIAIIYGQLVMVGIEVVILSIASRKKY